MSLMKYHCGITQWSGVFMFVEKTFLSIIPILFRTFIESEYTCYEGAVVETILLSELKPRLWNSTLILTPNHQTAESLAI